jgi:hypothetical protein
MKINLTIERFEDNEAILKSEDGFFVSWPKDKLPVDAKEKEIIIFNLNSEAVAETKNDNLAKDILNEILNAG